MSGDGHNHGGGELITRDEQLARLVSRLSGSARVAVDTEADSLHAYPEKLCLMQISAIVEGVVAGERGSIDVLIDPLAGLELGPLLACLRARELILHGADFDLRLLFRTYQLVPERVFDTMLAARLLGVERFGLQALLGARLGVAIEKGPRKANWARRPLSPRMIAYAENDTRYLEALAAGLREELSRCGRLEWHRELCERLIVECARERSVDLDRVWRLKGSARLGPRELAVLRALWQWREGEALRANKPPYFIVAHEELVALAASSSSSGAHLRVPSRINPRRRRGALEAVEQGRAVAADQRPRRQERTPTAPMTSAQQQRLAVLKGRRDQAANELGLDPTLIASKSALDRAARDPEGAEVVLLPWQQTIVLGA